MARTKDKSKAVELRKKGKSYSQIKAELGISKSTLSGWLRDMPLSEERIRALCDFSSIRIERYRNTMKAKREKRWSEVYKKVSKDIGKFTKRDYFLAGLFLYWAEGGKTSKYVTAFTNTDPAMLKFYIRWITSFFDIKKSELDVTLHLYKDMDMYSSTRFWCKELGLSRDQFKNPYIKTSKLTGLTYKTGFGKGTCNIRICDRDIKEYIEQSLEFLRNSINCPPSWTRTKDRASISR